MACSPITFGAGMKILIILIGYSLFQTYRLDGL